MRKLRLPKVKYPAPNHTVWWLVEVYRSDSRGILHFPLQVTEDITTLQLRALSSPATQRGPTPHSLSALWEGLLGKANPHYLHNSPSDSGSRSEAMGFFIRSATAGSLGVT